MASASLKGVHEEIQRGNSVAYREDAGEVKVKRSGSKDQEVKDELKGVMHVEG